MLTLEEAISREEALAYSFGERYKRLGEPVGDLMELEQEHRQMAEWLRELKGYREARQELEERHAVGTLDLIDSYIEEVNADGSNRCED